MAKIDIVAAKAKAYDDLVAFLQIERQKYIIHNDYDIVNYIDCYIDAARCMLRSEVIANMPKGEEECAEGAKKVRSMSNGIIMKCFKKIKNCCMANNCEFAIECQLGDEIASVCNRCDKRELCMLRISGNTFMCENVHEAFRDKSDDKDTVDIGKMQERILTLLLEARSNMQDTNQLGMTDMVAIVDALFYLVSRDPKIVNMEEK